MVCAQSRPYCATQVDMLIGCVLVQFLALSGMQNGPHMSRYQCCSISLSAGLFVPCSTSSLCNLVRYITSAREDSLPYSLTEPTPDQEILYLPSCQITPTSLRLSALQNNYSPTVVTAATTCVASLPPPFTRSGVGMLFLLPGKLVNPFFDRRFSKPD